MTNFVTLLENTHWYQPTTACRHRSPLWMVRCEDRAALDGRIFGDERVRSTKACLTLVRPKRELVCFSEARLLREVGVALGGVLVLPECRSDAVLLGGAADADGELVLDVVDHPLPPAGKAGIVHGNFADGVEYVPGLDHDRDSGIDSLIGELKAAGGPTISAIGPEDDQRGLRQPAPNDVDHPLPPAGEAGVVHRFFSGRVEYVPGLDLEETWIGTWARE
ncbi:hypothetical protein HO173_006235 [Letharia columbiana]|uniref:Uncharacterized protein n=1 Tax=Letharia columbiana TaxID=112416 RepID=A0A8H6FVM1_9LECA|nr:uncharacterized protein HO173_006235 [Letharia columbiana]KAF6235552.1 hypothetical protein HO173_006235 [Letharia columbiana]